MIEYTRRERTRNETTLGKLREMAESRLTLDPPAKVRRYAEAIAVEMARVHGGKFKVCVDHHCAFVFVDRE